MQVRIFTLVDEKEPILDAIYERLKQQTYIKDSEVLYQGGIIDKMVFIVRGKMESIGEDGIVVPLSEGDVCGEELLTWCLEHSSENRGQFSPLLYLIFTSSTKYVVCFQIWTHNYSAVLALINKQFNLTLRRIFSTIFWSLEFLYLEFGAMLKRCI